MSAVRAECSEDRQAAPVATPARAGAAGGVLAADILRLQRSIGNRAVGRLLQRVLQDGSATDPADPAPPAHVATELSHGKYDPGEAADSKDPVKEPGIVEETEFTLTLSNFGVGQSKLKPQHVAAVRGFKSKLGLEVDSLVQLSQERGFTDSVDTDIVNRALREGRAEAVRREFRAAGVQPVALGTTFGAPLAEIRAPNDTRAGRAANRAVEVTTKLSPGPALPPSQDPDPNKGKACDKKTSSHWSITTVVAANSALKVGVGGLVMNAIVEDTEHHCKHMLVFTGGGLAGGVSFPASASFPSATDFETTSPVTIRDFVGLGRVTFAEAAFILGWVEEFVHFDAVTTKPGTIDVSGFEAAAGLDGGTSVGRWTYVG